MSEKPMKNKPVSLTLNSIGVFESSQVEPYQAGRQPDALGYSGKINLHSGFNFEQALQDLAGCTHIWIIFGFHYNTNWKPLVQPPRSNKKIGVFATRAPYRPNPLGMSLVKLVDIKNLCVEVAENDILNGSPVYDIKPFHPEYDKVEDASIEWLEKSAHTKNEIRFSPTAEDQIDFLSHYDASIRTFAIRQLEYDAINSDKKRVEQNGQIYTLAYRTWRIDFTTTENIIAVLLVRSGYTKDDLDETCHGYTDAYSDKDIHRKFNLEFS